ncbi:MAG: T9SS type A sorting domain-containing protein, partial [Dyadobacter sp.]|uniref:T9SS type A sorting domain-containing protein n=1 Tax=Dyadobacter sp. TaxID=1914288 RepID=UPI003266194D
TVELIEGTTVHATALANIYKETVKNAGFGTGNYGFYFALPAALKDGKAHVLSMRVQGSTTILNSSPKTITCGVNQYQGNLDVADCNTVSGWAWDKNFPNNAVTVELFEGSTVYGTVLANVYRESLKTAGYGTGNYSFTMALPTALKDGVAHQLSARVKGTTTLLWSSPRSVTCISNEYFGNFELASCDVIAGWAWDKNAPNSALTVELIEGTTVHATALANIYKATVKNAGFGTGNYGFYFTLPAALKDGKAHVLSMRVKGSSKILNSSPKTITCATAARIGVPVEVLTPASDDHQFKVESIKSSLAVSPNPTAGKIRVSFSSLNKQSAKLSVVNILGQVVWEEQVTGTGERHQQFVDLSGNTNGIYLVRLQMGEMIEIKRIVLMK